MVLFSAKHHRYIAPSTSEGNNNPEKISPSHFNEYEIAFVLTVKDNNSEKKCGIRGPGLGENNETNNSE